MTHPKLRRQQMLEWIRTAIERGQAVPSDAQIVEAFNLSGVESARTLLADLADEQQIFITWSDGGREIALERSVRKLVTPTPLPDLGRKRDRELERGTAKIMAIATRHVPRPVADRAAQPVAASARPVTPTAPVASLPSAPVAAIAQPEPPVTPQPLPTLVERHVAAKSRQVNSKVPATLYDAIGALAQEAGVAVSTIAGQLLDEAIRQRARPSWCKPNLSAAVMAAHARVGGDLGQFVTGLIERGLRRAVVG